MSETSIDDSDELPSQHDTTKPPAKFEVTASQYEIITAHPSHDTILSVTAGPGSGKTFTLTQRIAHLISNHDVQPHEILVLLMANRSVNSLKDSLERDVGLELAAQVDISTFHSFCSRIIDAYGPRFLPRFKRKKLIDDQGWKNAMSLFLGKTVKIRGQQIGGNMTAKQLDKMIFELRSGNLTVEEAAEIHEVNAAYIKMLMEYLDSQGIMRYNDLVIHASAIMNKSRTAMAEDPKAIIDLLHNYKVVIVDEFQDMHLDLLSIIRDVVTYPTADQKRNTIKHLTIAGDPNQSIYDFLGSNPLLMNNLHEEFANVHIQHKVIAESFRCTPEILKASIDLCLGKNDLTLRLYATRDSGNLPVIKKINSQAEESSFVIEEIIRLICELGGLLKPCDFVILARTNKEVDHINKMMVNNYGMKFNKLSSSVLWSKSRLHMLLDILTIIEMGAGSELAWLCFLLELDSSNGGKARVANFFNLSQRWADATDTTGGDVLEQWITSFFKSQIDPRYSINLVYKTPSQRRFVEDIRLIFQLIVQERDNLQRNAYNQDPLTLIETLANIVDNLLIKRKLNDPALKVTQSKQELKGLTQKHQKTLSDNLRDFYKSMLVSYNRFKSEVKPGHESFLSFFLKTYNDDVPVYSIDLINTSTIHAAKGLEFPIVFILNSALPYMPSSWEKIIEGIAQLPNSNSRLLYVGITRAKDLLYLSTSKNISDVGEAVMDNFTTQLPKLDQRVFHLLSSSLQRPLPTSKQLVEGRELLKLFRNMNTVQTRRLHYTIRKNTLRKNTLINPLKLYKHLYIRKIV